MLREGDPVWVQGFRGQVLDFTRSPEAQLDAELNALTEGYTGPGVMWADETPRGAMVQVGTAVTLWVPLRSRTCLFGYEYRDAAVQEAARQAAQSGAGGDASEPASTT